MNETIKGREKARHVATCLETKLARGSTQSLFHFEFDQPTFNLSQKTWNIEMENYNCTYCNSEICQFCKKCLYICNQLDCGTRTKVDLTTFESLHCVGCLNSFCRYCYTAHEDHHAQCRGVSLIFIYLFFLQYLSDCSLVLGVKVVDLVFIALVSTLRSQALSSHLDSDQGITWIENIIVVFVVLKCVQFVKKIMTTAKRTRVINII